MGDPADGQQPDLIAAERLAAQLEVRYGLASPVATSLDVDVFRVDRRDGPSWVARVFPAERPLQSVLGDAAILRALERNGFPAERCAHAEPVSTVDGLGVLVTEFVQAGAPLSPGRRAAVLGDLLGRLHSHSAEGLRAGGAWHHLSFSGGPREEVAAACNLLDGVHASVGIRELAQFDRLRAAAQDTDDCADLAHAFVHPDFVPANAIATSDGRLVIVDWAGAGRGPRVWSLGFLLWAAGARSLRLVDVAASRYARHITLEPEELLRLGAAIRGRPTMLECWAFCHRRRALVDAVERVSEIAALADQIAKRACEVFADHRVSPHPPSTADSAPGVRLEETTTDPVIRPFDVAALYAALDAHRTELDLSWRQVANGLWDLSSTLNDQRHDHPISPSTLTGMAKNPRATCQHVLFMLRWLDRSPESFLEGATGDDPRFALPRAGSDRRLRWDLKRLYQSLDDKRGQRGLTWRELASVLACGPRQLTGLRTAKYSANIDLAMRVVQWIGRPAAGFVYAATW